MNCNNKIKYPNKNAALIALSEINSEYSEDRGIQTAYECKHHECWHTGHSKDYSDNPFVRINQIFEQKIFCRWSVKVLQLLGSNLESGDRACDCEK